MAINNVGDYQEFSYTGNIQSFTPTIKGIYKLEVWGAEGGSEDQYGTASGKGGYSVGYLKLQVGVPIYVVVGGSGGRGYSSTDHGVSAGGYNGGGNGINQYSFRCGGGGGATHISFATGLLSTDAAWNNVIIVAGGGGGSASNYRDKGGAGGGLMGESLAPIPESSAAGGTQTTGYAKGLGQSCTASDNAGAGAGGGYYGGFSVGYMAGSGRPSGGAGGSGYIGGVPEFTLNGVTYSPSTTMGGNTNKYGTGHAIITFVAQIMEDIGDQMRFNYTGGMQSFEISKKALYKLEVWGGKGGDGYLHGAPSSSKYDHGGNGGYSIGYKILDAGQTIYICVGGQGQKGSGSYSGAAGGYNGGGSSGAKWIDPYEISNGAGGGATHMALVSGTLVNIGYTDFVTNGKGLIVAGGGGGGLSTENGEGRDGGAGGGLSGSNGQLCDHPGSDPTDGKGGTQTTGYAFGLGESTPGGYYTENKTPGGGGFYGGYGGCQSAVGFRLEVSGSGGGSGWVDGVPTITLKGQTYMPGSSNGINAGDGYAIITYVADVFPSITFDSVLISTLIKDGHNIDSVSYNGTIIS